MPKTLVLILSLGTAILTGGIFYVVKHGYKPESVKVLDLSQFKHPQAIGAAIFKRFWNEMQTAQVVVLGEDNALKSGLQVWAGFIDEGIRRGIKFDLILSDPRLEDVDQYLAAGRRVLVRMHSTDAAIAALDKHPWPNALYIHQSLFVPGATDEIEKQHPCESSHDDKLECKIQLISKQYRRKRYLPDQYIGVMEQSYPNQYVLFIYEPSEATP